MPCYSPLAAWRGGVGPSGKRQIVFSPPKVQARDCEISLPCGQCVGCRLERSRQWAMRCVHEASLYSRNAFVTLTYSNRFLPKDGSVSVREFQLFMKRLRKAYPEDRIRFFHCGEYGEKLGRPHYHACLFNFDFPDKKIFQVRPEGTLYTSDTLTRLWGKGDKERQLIGDVTFESAAYVARYIMKKVNGDAADPHYGVVDTATGEIVSTRKPEYITMSRRPGIGRGWYDKYKTDVFPSDYLVTRGVKVRPPKFYDAQLEKEDPLLLERLKRARVARALQVADDNTPERLKVKEEVKLSQVSKLKRSLEGIQ